MPKKTPDLHVEEFFPVEAPASLIAEWQQAVEVLAEMLLPILRDVLETGAVSSSQEVSLWPTPPHRQT